MTVNKWTDKEKLFLEENYSLRGAKYCSLKLNRTIVAIRRMAKKTGCSYDRMSYSVEDISIAISKSCTITDVIRCLGLRTAGGNHKTIKGYIEKYNLDISHFKTKKEIYSDILSRIRNTKQLNELLVNGVSLNSTNIKKRLFKEGVKKNECEMCGQGEIWNGRQMSLIIDHINGVHSDWRLENLRIVCPNCNATLDTHCGKNVKKNRKCKNCNKSVSLGSNYCRKCNTEIINSSPEINFKKRKIKDRPKKEELIDSVNKVGYVKTGIKYGVSDNTIRKWIKNGSKNGGSNPSPKTY